MSQAPPTYHRVPTLYPPPNMLITLEIVVFTFGAVVTIVTALLKLVNYLAELRSLMISMRGEVEYIKQQQAQHREELSNGLADFRTARSAYGHGPPYS